MNPEYWIVGKPNCPWCDKAKELLKDQGKSFDYSCVVENPEELNNLKRLELTTVPQIWKEGQHIGGYSELAQELGV